MKNIISPQVSGDFLPSQGFTTNISPSFFYIQFLSYYKSFLFAFLKVDKYKLTSTLHSHSSLPSYRRTSLLIETGFCGQFYHFLTYILFFTALRVPRTSIPLCLSFARLPKPQLPLSGNIFFLSVPSYTLTSPLSSLIGPLPTQSQMLTCSRASS